MSLALTRPDDVAAAAQLACILEANAPKPGNVSPGMAFRDTRYEDFVASAAAIGPAIAAAGIAPLGATIRSALEATRRWTTSNTNLGIVLLLAPLARAALHGAGNDLRARAAAVLGATTVDDARDTYAAIRLVHPGGLGATDQEDVSATPTVTLHQAMVLAAGRDGVAREYSTGFAGTFERGAPTLRAALSAGLDWTDAILETYLIILGSAPDTLIARKLGPEAAGAISDRAREAQAGGGVRTAAGRQAIAALDAELRDPGNSRNPGTSADLTAAAIFAVLLEDGWRGPEGRRRG